MISPKMAPVDQRVKLDVDLQLALDGDTQSLKSLPTEDHICQRALQAYSFVQQRCELPCDNEVTVRIVEQDEIIQLNRDYRGKSTPTNVLSFPFDVPQDVGVQLLGDIVICHQVIVTEAHVAGKTVAQHYAHMVTHGVLHLCGYDHQCDATATVMEDLEAQIMALQGLPNPY